MIFSKNLKELFLHNELQDIPRAGWYCICMGTLDNQKQWRRTCKVVSRDAGGTMVCEVVVD